MYVNNRMGNSQNGTAKYQTNPQLKSEKNPIDNTRSKANHVDKLHKKIDINAIITSSDKYPNSLKYGINSNLKKMDDKILINDVSVIMSKKGNNKPNSKTKRNSYKKISSICFQKFSTYKNKNVPFLSDLPFFSRLPLLKDNFHDSNSADFCKTLWKNKRNQLLCDKFSKHTTELLPICSKYSNSIYVIKPEITVNKYSNKIFGEKYSRVTGENISQDEIIHFKQFLLNKSIPFDIYSTYKIETQTKLINEFFEFKKFLKTTTLKDYNRYHKNIITNEKKQELMKEFDKIKIDNLINSMNINKNFINFLLNKSIPFDKYSEYDPQDKIKLIEEFDTFRNDDEIKKIDIDKFIDFLLMKSVEFGKSTKDQLIKEFTEFNNVLVENSITIAEFKNFLIIKSIPFDTYNNYKLNEKTELIKEFTEFKNVLVKNSITIAEFKNFLIIKSIPFDTYNNYKLNEKTELIEKIKSLKDFFKKKSITFDEFINFLLIKSIPYNTYNNTEKTQLMTEFVEFKNFIEKKSITFQKYIDYSILFKKELIKQFENFKKFLEKNDITFQKYIEATNTNKTNLINTFKDLNIFLVEKSIPFDTYINYEDEEKTKLMTEIENFKIFLEKNFISFQIYSKYSILFKKELINEFEDFKKFLEKKSITFQMCNKYTSDEEKKELMTEFKNFRKQHTSGGKRYTRRKRNKYKKKYHK